MGCQYIHNYHRERKQQSYRWKYNVWKQGCQILLSKFLIFTCMFRFHPFLNSLGIFKIYVLECTLTTLPLISTLPCLQMLSIYLCVIISHPQIGLSDFIHSSQLGDAPQFPLSATLAIYKIFLKIDNSDFMILMIVVYEYLSKHQQYVEWTWNKTFSTLHL